MARSTTIVRTVTLAVALSLSWAASAESVRSRASYSSTPAGRQIIVHPREPYLTAGTGATVGSQNRYVWETFRPAYRNTIQGTFVGMRGDERLPNRFTVPGSDEPLLTF